MKPRIRPLSSSHTYYRFTCSGSRPDGCYAFGIGITIEQAYAEWLVYDENDIPF